MSEKKVVSLNEKREHGDKTDRADEWGAEEDLGGMHGVQAGVCDARAHVDGADR